MEPLASTSIVTAETRICQLVHCRERNDPGGKGRDVYIANSHLSFPGHDDPLINEERQAKEVDIILDALSSASSHFTTTSNNNKLNESLQIIAGDFNSNSQALAASLCESHNYVNCASATAQQSLSDVGGPIELGVTHCNHLGERVSVDHVFLRLQKGCKESVEVNTATSQSTQSSAVMNRKCPALAMGYLDTKGTRILQVQKEDIVIEGTHVLSDHRPVTVSIDWPRIRNVTLKKNDSSLEVGDLYVNATLPLDPLEPAWGIVQ